MSAEMRSMPAADRSAAEQKLRTYGATLQSLKRDLSAAIRQGDRDELLGGKKGDENYRRMKDSERFC
jgi:hypothetical protein